MPFAAWTFETDARDVIGSLHGTLLGGAFLRDGRLCLDGTAAYLRTSPLPVDFREKTLEAWVILPTLVQHGGAAMSILHGSTVNNTVFDAVVFANTSRANGTPEANSPIEARTFAPLRNRQAGGRHPPSDRL